MPSYPPYNEIKMSGKTGGASNNNIIIWSDIITPTVAIGQTIDISSANFSTITNVQLTTERLVTDPMQIADASLQSKTTSQLKVNITQGNTATVVLLNQTILSGPPVVAATNLSNILLHVRVEGF